MNTKTIKVTNWDNKDIELNKPEYIKLFTEKLDFLDMLVSYDDAKEEERDGASYYIESKSEEMISDILQSVRTMASDEFDRIVSRQKDKLVA